MQLTRDTDKMFCLIYEEYLNRRKSGIPKSAAIRFEHPVALQSEFLQGIHEDDIYCAIRELDQKNFVKKYINASFELSDDGIIYMENRFKSGLKEVLEYIAMLK